MLFFFRRIYAWFVETVLDCMKSLASSDASISSTSAQTATCCPDLEVSDEMEKITIRRIPMQNILFQQLNKLSPGVIQLGGPSQPRMLFPNLRKSTNYFPFFEVVKSIIREEWEKPEKNLSSNNQFSKFYPLKEEDISSRIHAPLVYPSIMLLAKHVILPMDNAVSFHNPLEWMIDLDPKRFYLAAGGAIHTAAALLYPGPYPYIHIYTHTPF